MACLYDRHILILLMNNFGKWYLPSLSIFQMLEEGVLLDISVLVEFGNFMFFNHSFTTHFIIIIIIFYLKTGRVSLHRKTCMDPC